MTSRARSALVVVIEILYLLDPDPRISWGSPLVVLLGFRLGFALGVFALGVSRLGSERI